MAIPIPVALLALPVIIFSLLPPRMSADYVLYAGEVLMAGQNLTNGRHHLAMQSNCDLVIYDVDAENKPTWGTNTGGKGQDCYLGLKQNGELVIRRNVHYTLWSSMSKSKKGKYALVLDDHGRLGIYGQRRWASNNQKEIVGRRDGRVVSSEYVLYSGRPLTPPKKLKYKNYELGFTRRCNLVLSDSRSGKALWQTSTQGKSNACSLQLEADGELTVKHNNQMLWSSSKRAENGRYIAVLRFDGRLNVYGPLLWTNDNLYEDDDSLLSADAWPRIADSALSTAAAME